MSERTTEEMLVSALERLRRTCHEQGEEIERLKVECERGLDEIKRLRALIDESVGSPRPADESPAASQENGAAGSSRGGLL